MIKTWSNFFQTPDLDQDLSLGVDFVFPLEQQQLEEEEEHFLDSNKYCDKLYPVI